ncbi:type II toxin-antitoxin system VapC family toxin [Terriglobus sp.]|uniref:type II toxin-antitoxin system VapC family toxin n=1 Tax=Terriglobus sp. TaxID=1889013 RepID=UPI003B000EF9
MKLLLDSHVLLWYDVSALNSKIRASVDMAEEVYISAATVWELTFKQTVGKLKLTLPVVAIAKRNGVALMSITPEHAQLAGELPLYHCDPFDRMLVAQARIESLTLVTHDKTLQQYGIAVLLA